MKANAPSPPLWIMAIVVGLFSMLGALSIDIYFPSFSAMEVAFTASPASIQQTLTAYMIPYALASLFYGPLSDAMGRRTLLLISLVVFGIASLACALSNSLEAILAWRAIQGISAGAPKVIGRAIVRDITRLNKLNGPWPGLASYLASHQRAPLSSGLHAGLLAIKHACMPVFFVAKMLA